jgi:hypothetical protein
MRFGATPKVGTTHYLDGLHCMTIGVARGASRWPASMVFDAVRLHASEAVCVSA